MIAWTLALLLAAALVVVWLRLRVHRREADRLSNVRKHLLARAEEIRNELRIAAAERDTAVEQLDPVLAENAKLRDQLRKSLAWRNQLRTAAEEQAYLMSRPDPHRTREQRAQDRERAAWNSRMRAVFDAPSRIPPHEQQDGADQ